MDGSPTAADTGTAADTVTISRADYETLRTAALAAIGVSGMVAGLVTVRLAEDGTTTEISLNPVLDETLARANEVLGPMGDGFVDFVDEPSASQAAAS